MASKLCDIEQRVRTGIDYHKSKNAFHNLKFFSESWETSSDQRCKVADGVVHEGIDKVLTKKKNPSLILTNCNVAHFHPNQELHLQAFDVLARIVAVEDLKRECEVEVVAIGVSVLLRNGINLETAKKNWAKWDKVKKKILSLSS